MRTSALIATALSLAGSTYADLPPYASTFGRGGIWVDLTKVVEIFEIADFTKTCQNKGRLEGADVVKVNFQCELMHGQMATKTQRAGSSGLVTAIYKGASVTSSDSQTLHPPTGTLATTSIEPSAVYSYGVCDCGGAAHSSGRRSLVPAPWGTQSGGSRSSAPHPGGTNVPRHAERS